MVDSWSWYWRPRGLGLSCVQLAVLLTTHRGSHQWLLLIAIEVNPSHTTTTGSWIGVDLEVRPLVAFINSDRGKPLSRHHHWDLEVRTPSTCSRSTIGWRRVLRWWRRLGRSHNMGRVTRILKSMMLWCLMKFVGVSGTGDQIMWVITHRDHVIGRSRDHDITIAFPLRRELRWAWKLSVDEWKLGEKPPNPMKETEEENQGKIRTS